MKHLLLLASILTLGFGCTQSNVEEASKEFNKMPPIVQQVVRTRYPNAEIADVEQQTRNGIRTYLIQFRDPKRYPEIEIAADGRVVKYEAGTVAMGRPGREENVQQGSAMIEPSLSALPIPVQRAIIANAPKADVMEINRREENGRTTYEIVYAGKAPREVLHLNPEGQILKKGTESKGTESNVATNQVPGK